MLARKGKDKGTGTGACLPLMSSPYRVLAMEYRRTELGFPFAFVPGGITPRDWPSQKRKLPPWSIWMSQISPGAFGPTMRFTDEILPMRGA